MNEDIITKEKKAPKKPTRKPKAENLAALEPVYTVQPESASKEAVVENPELEDAAPIAQLQEVEDAVPMDQAQEVEKFRTLCKLVKHDYLKKHFQEYQELVLDPLFICHKCGRVAREKHYLCRPVLIKKEAESSEVEAMQI
jgi:hypothetical protein